MFTIEKTTGVQTAPILCHRQPHLPVATRLGQPIRADRFVADVWALAARLPHTHYVLNTCQDRYAFAVAFCAALVTGQTNLLPPARNPQTLAYCARAYPALSWVCDADQVHHGFENHPQPIPALDMQIPAPSWPPPDIPTEHVAAIVFTSGSTGMPQPQLKRWGALVHGAHSEQTALELHDDDKPLALVGTVSAQHMYGLESTVLLALHGSCVLATEHPLHPEEVATTLASQPYNRVLVTTPIHLRALINANVTLKRLHSVVSATAPLDKGLAQQCETTWQAPVREIYGCTETGMIATRRTCTDPYWTLMNGVTIDERANEFVARGGHVVQPAALADALRLHGTTAFELLGRSQDLINIAGKRASIAGLNHILLEIPGVMDGVFFLPDTGPTTLAKEPRLTALVVAPNVACATVLSELRKRVDPVFLPRPLLKVAALPRNPQGKLPKAALLALAQRAKSASALQ